MKKGDHNVSRPESGRREESKTVSSDTRDAVLYPLFPTGAIKSFFLAPMAVIALLVLFAPSHPPDDASTWDLLFRWATRIADVRTMAGKSDFPLATALGYSLSLTLSIVTAVLSLFVRLRMSVYEELRRKLPARTRFLYLAFALVLFTIPFYVEGLRPSSLSGAFFEAVGASRAVLLCFLVGIFGAMATMWFWILLEIAAVLRRIRR